MGTSHFETIIDQSTITDAKKPLLDRFFLNVIESTVFSRKGFQPIRGEKAPFSRF